MLDSKFLFTLIGLLVAVYAISNTNMSPSISEGFWGNPGRAVKVMKEIGTPDGGREALMGNYPFIQSVPKFQGLLSTRFSDVQYGANIRYNFPSYGNLASPQHPLAMSDMANANYNDTRENFARCGKGGVSTGATISQGIPNISDDPNYVSAMDKIYADGHTPSVISDGIIPVGNMETINADGQLEQPIIYDRLIVANLKSNLHAQGDFIRGDLAITPCTGQWFNVHPNLAVDLNAGAMNVMGGVKNESANAVSQLIYESSGRTDTTTGGVNLNMSNEFGTTYSAANGDVSVHLTGSP